MVPLESIRSWLSVNAGLLQRHERMELFAAFGVDDSEGIIQPAMSKTAYTQRTAGLRATHLDFNISLPLLRTVGCVRLAYQGGRWLAAAATQTLDLNTALHALQRGEKHVRLSSVTPTKLEYAVEAAADVAAAHLSYEGTSRFYLVYTGTWTSGQTPLEGVTTQVFPPRVKSALNLYGAQKI